MLYHFSEDPNIVTFNPRPHPSYPHLPPMVWAIDEQHAPLYFFPRGCPRVAFWPGQGSLPSDIKSFMVHSSARMVIAVESGWLSRLRSTTLFVYHLPPQTFSCFDGNAGYFTSSETVVPTKVEPMDDLLDQLVLADVEVRITPSLIALHQAVAQSTLQFSMIRMRNARENQVNGSQPPI